MKKQEYTVHIYHGGEQADETRHTDCIDTARKWAKHGEHSEIVNSQAIFIQ